MKAIGRKILSGTAWMAVETWGQQAILFTVFILLARLLGPEAIGLAALTMVAPIILAIPVVKGIPEAIVQRPVIEVAHLDSAFWLLTAGGIVISGGIWLSAELIAWAFGQPALLDLVRTISLVVVIQALASVPAAILKRELNFRVLALRTLAGTVSGGAVGIGMAIAGFGVWSLVWMQITKSAVETVVLLVSSTWRPHLRYSNRHTRDLLAFARPIVGFSLWTYVNDEMPKMMLGAFLGPGAVGIYALARRPLELVTQVILSPLTSITLPVVSRLQDDPPRVERFFDAAVRAAGFIGFPAFMGLAAVAPDAIPLLLGGSWDTGILPIQILMLLGLVRTIDGLCAGTVLALGHSSLILKLNMAYTAIAALSLGAAAQVNLEVTMLALVACNLALVPVFLYYTRKLVGINVLKPLSVFPRLAFMTLLMFTAVTAWRLAAEGHATQGVVLAGGILVGVVVYGAAAIGLMRSDLVMAREVLLKMRS